MEFPEVRQLFKGAYSNFSTGLAAILSNIKFLADFLIKTGENKVERNQYTHTSRLAPLPCLRLSTSRSLAVNNMFTWWKTRKPCFQRRGKIKIKGLTRKMKKTVIFDCPHLKRHEKSAEWSISTAPRSRRRHSLPFRRVSAIQAFRSTKKSILSVSMRR